MVRIFGDADFEAAVGLEYLAQDRGGLDPAMGGMILAGHQQDSDRVCRRGGCRSQVAQPEEEWEDPSGPGRRNRLTFVVIG